MEGVTVSKKMKHSQKTSDHKNIYICLFFACALVGLSFLVTSYMLVASLSYFMMLGGLMVRKWPDKTLHVRLMTSAIFLDIALVLILELQRNAIDTAVSLKLSGLQMAHIGSSSLATLLYIPIFIIGRMLWKQKSNRSQTLRKWHLRLAIPAFIFRTLGFILMFTLLSHVTNGA